MRRRGRWLILLQAKTARLGSSSVVSVGVDEPRRVTSACGRWGTSRAGEGEVKVGGSPGREEATRCRQI